MYWKLTRILVSVLLVYSVLASPAFAESAVITGSRVNVRPGPGTDYYPITSLERNTVVDIVNRYNDAWYEINYNGILGYVSSAYLNTADSSSAGLTVIQVPQNNTAGNITPSGSAVPASSAGGENTFYVNAMYVRFRSGPGSDYSIVGEYNKGKEIQVVTTVGDWVAGYIDGNPGYIHKNYVSKGSAAAAGSTQSGQSGIIVLTPTPTASSDLPQPYGTITVVTPSPSAAPASSGQVVVLSQPGTAAAPTATPAPAVPTPVPALSADGVKGYVVGTYVRFRTGPGSNYSIINTYNTGKELIAYADTGGGWLFCTIDGKEGYIHGSYVYITDIPAKKTSAQTQSVQGTAPTAQPVSVGAKTGYIIGNNVRFRADASMTSQILGELFYGNQVTITGTCGEWTQIVYGDRAGFVYSTYVMEGSYAAAQPAAASTGTTAAVSPAAVISANVSGQDIVNFAGQLLGSKYCWGGSSPETGFDCSGFVYYVYKHFGINLNRVAADQVSNGVHVDPNNLMPGDILCFYSGSSYIGHAGIYIGNNKFIHSSNSTTGVIISDLSGYYANRGFEARRIVSK